MATATSALHAFSVVEDDDDDDADDGSARGSHSTVLGTGIYRTGWYCLSESEAQVQMGGSKPTSPHMATRPMQARYGGREGGGAKAIGSAQACSRARVCGMIARVIG